MHNKEKDIKYWDTKTTQLSNRQKEMQLDEKNKNKTKT